MKNFIKKRKLNIICSVSAVLVMLAVWIIAYFAVKNDYLIPSFTDTLKSFKNLFADGEFWLSFFNTFGRTLLAFVFSFLLAALLAVPSVLSKTFFAFIKPVAAFLRTLPTLAVVLIFLMWTNPVIAPVAVTVLILFPMIYAQITAAAEGVDEGLLEMARVYGLRKRERLFKIYLPLVSPNILAQTGANLSLGLKIMISSEVLANTYNSLGGLMQTAKLYAEMPRLAALTLVAVFIGLIIDVALSQFERINYKWSIKEGARD